ncbi:unnamed protein product [Brassica oleracea var. botrytis]|uniref:Uncharacterized protein n=2 Tax=Brassica TaxID=3705 RepID=A0A3P6D7S4_BRAOL|nr:unnamed protein product [Brassica napus]VDD27167.1 unnamed protein product [Brassica oleracea]
MCGENGTAPVKPGTGLTVAVKTLNLDGLQGHKEWLIYKPSTFDPTEHGSPPTKMM